MTLLFTPPSPALTPDPDFAHRQTETVLTLADSQGEPLADREVTVKQLRHQFQFGCTGFELIDWINGQSKDPEYDAAMAESWLNLFDTATLPF